MDSSDKLYFNKILTSLDGISSSLEGGGMETTTLTVINDVYFAGKFYYIGDSGNIETYTMEGEHLFQLSIKKYSFLCFSSTNNLPYEYNENKMLFLGSIDSASGDPYGIIDGSLEGGSYWGDAFLILEDDPVFTFVNE